MMPVRTRFAPSPTGVLHLGSVRTALFCWLYARHNNGTYIVRIEDTDRERSTDENVTAIFEALAWLGMEADEEPVYQTHRFERYNEVLAEWLESGKAYHCYCTRDELMAVREQQKADGEKTRYNGRCRNSQTRKEDAESVVRFKNPDGGHVVVDDAIRGRVEFQNKELDDLIIRRSDGSPTYNFTVVVDDSDMQITHVIRGDDHLNNTPRQINMLEALGAALPVYAHLPMILGADGAKLSKRHGAVDIRDYQKQGYLPSAMLNYLVRLGWSYGDQEIFTMQEMVDLFDLSSVNQSASAFNPDKLRWINQQHIIAAAPDEIGKALVPFLLAQGFDLANGPAPIDVATVFRERAETLSEMAASATYCYRDFDTIDSNAAKKNLRPVALDPMLAARERFAMLDDWSADKITAVIADVAAEHEIKMGKLGQPIRVAVTGGSVSPPIDMTLWLVGKVRTIDRLDHAIGFIRKRAEAS